MSLNVVLLGYGAIGKSLHQMLASNPRINLIGMLDRSAASTAMAGTGVSATKTASGNESGSGILPILSLAEALERADIIAECASPAAVAALGPHIIASGTDLLIASLGALVDDEVRTSIMDAGPGRAYLSTGAIGGLDLIRASGNTIEGITLKTSKQPAGLLHSGLDELTRNAITTAARAQEPQIVFSGTVAEAIELFPSNINVAAALGLAAGNFDLVRVSIEADPTNALTRHSISVRGSGGTYDFSIGNTPDPQNPATSALTARSMASGLLRLAGIGPHFI